MNTNIDGQAVSVMYPHLNVALVMPVDEIERLATYHQQKGNTLCSELFLRALELKTATE